MLRRSEEFPKKIKAVFGVGLLENMIDVGLDSGNGNKVPMSDFFVRKSKDQVGDEFYFCLREMVVFGKL